MATSATVRDALTRSLALFPPIVDLEKLVYSSVGKGREEVDLLGYHTFISSTRVAVYLITKNCLGLYESDSEGKTITLTVSVTRIRRVVRTEDSSKTTLTIELEAGQYQSVVDPGSSDVVTSIPAGYELGETSQEGRESLRAFQVAVSYALNSR